MTVMRAWLVVVVLTSPSVPSRFGGSRRPAHRRSVVCGASSPSSMGRTDRHPSLKMVASPGRRSTRGCCEGVWGARSTICGWCATIGSSLDRWCRAYWANQIVPISATTTLEGILGVGEDRYVFGADRSSQTGVLLHSRDRGASVKSEPIDLPRMTIVGGRDTRCAVGARDVMRSTGGIGADANGPRDAARESAGTAPKTLLCGSGQRDDPCLDGKTWGEYEWREPTRCRRHLVNVRALCGQPRFRRCARPTAWSWKPLSAMVKKGHVFASERIIAVRGRLRVRRPSYPSHRLRSRSGPRRSTSPRWDKSPRAHCA